MKQLKLFIVTVVIAGCASRKPMPAVVFQTDFGLKDGAVSAMKGVAKTVDAGLALYDLTHEIPPYDIWEAAYRLKQTIDYWPAGTVFVSVVDPGVGTNRKSVVALLNSGHYVVTPDNGVLTLLAKAPGIVAIHEIDEKTNRRAGSDKSYTFHGRDVYAYVAARLAAGKISFDQVGPLAGAGPVLLEYTEPEHVNDGAGGLIRGSIPALDPAYGNVWSNIPDSMLSGWQLHPGDSLSVSVSLKDSVVFAGRVPFVSTFGSVADGQPLLYLNSLMNIALALNMRSFADQYHISKGPGWTLSLRRN